MEPFILNQMNPRPFALRFSKRVPVVAIALSLALLNACAIGPNYKRPVVDTPPAYRSEAPEPHRSTRPRSPTCRGGRSSKTRYSRA